MVPSVAEFGCRCLTLCKLAMYLRCTLHQDHLAYRCKTCGMSDSSCMCTECFDPDDHIGHDYRMYRRCAPHRL